MNSNNICIKEDSVSYPSIDENEDTYENEDDLLDSTENKTDDLYVSKKRRLMKHDVTEKVAKRTFLCKHVGINKPNKTVPFNEQLTTYIDKHKGHSLNPQTVNLLPQFRKLTEDMLADIQF
ncbi:12027_t:CDS:2 [Funneliformis geosporum]|nr:12027_t:CDS:2 [Funneliformis geosporum]